MVHAGEFMHTTSSIAATWLHPPIFRDTFELYFIQWKRRSLVCGDVLGFIPFSLLYLLKGRKPAAMV